MVRGGEVVLMTVVIALMPVTIRLIVVVTPSPSAPIVVRVHLPRPPSHKTENVTSLGTLGPVQTPGSLNALVTALVHWSLVISGQL